MPKFEVQVYGRGGGVTHHFEVDTDDPQDARKYGTLAKEIADEVARDFCDSGSVKVFAKDRKGGIADKAIKGRW